MKNNQKIVIKKASAADLDGVLSVEHDAFGSDEVANLTRDLLEDSSSQPLISLLAFHENQAVGHILFTKARLDSNESLQVSILAPLAVIPDFQKQGVGGQLIRKGLTLLSESSVDLVFVLGHIEYYPRHGFKPAGVLGLKAPYPIPEEVADAWMVQALRPDVLNNCTGTIICADAMDKPEHWQE
jgi:putative acetyltransferase